MAQFLTWFLREDLVVAVLFEYDLENQNEARVLDFLGERVWTAQAKKAKFRNAPI
ncbi:MAG: hypothetical protein AB8F94_17270 [Saprospiraceae bacterium]